MYDQERLSSVGPIQRLMEVETLPISLSHPAHSSINDNYCRVIPPVKDIVEDQNFKDKTHIVNSNVVFPVPFVTGQSQRKDISPYQCQREIKHVKLVCCVSHCLYAHNVRNVHHVVENPPVGGRLQMFWQVWLSLGSNPSLVSILKKWYSLPFKVRPPLSRSPVIISHYADPVRNKHLKNLCKHYFRNRQWKRCWSLHLWLFTTGCFWCQNPTTSGDPS